MPSYADKTPAQRRAHSQKQLIRLANASKGASIRTPHVKKAVDEARKVYKKKKADLLYKQATTHPRRKKAHGPAKPTTISRKKKSAQDMKQMQDRQRQERETQQVRRRN